MKRIFLVDTENISSYIFLKKYNLTKEDKIILFVSPNSKKLSFGVIEFIQKNKIKMEMEFIETTVKNSMDYQLLILLARKTALSSKAEYFVVSNDKGFEETISYLNKVNKCNVKILKENTAETQVAATEEENNDEIQKIIKMNFPKEAENLYSFSLKYKEEHPTLSNFHNSLDKKFGEIGKIYYRFLKSNKLLKKI